MRIECLDENIINKYSHEIKQYLKQVLDMNNIFKTEQEIEVILKDMINYTIDGSAIILGAFKQQELLGFIWAYEKKNNSESRYHISYFIVNKKNRGQGIGKKLIQEIYEIAKKNNIKKVELIVTASNQGAVKFYENENFNMERIILCKEI